MAVEKGGLNDALAVCCYNTKAFCKVLLPERFFRPFSTLHDEIFAILNDDNIQLAAIAAPRGFGKTSIVNLAYPAQKILFQEKKFIVQISATATKAVMDSENLKRELVTNVITKDLFGNIKSGTFSKESWITATGTMVFPRGTGQQIRGLLYGHYRPDLIIVDDMETPEDVDNDETRAKVKRWFFADVLNSVDRGEKNWKIVVIGTILHEASLLAELLEGGKGLNEMAYKTP